MKGVSLTGQLKRHCQNRDGVTFLMAIFMVMIIGIMLGLTGQSWKTIMQREREKELLFRGSQIKEAIENWYDKKYTVPGVPPRAAVHPLMDLKDLLKDPYSLTPMRYLPLSYGTDLDGKSSKCAPDCPKLKVYEDPMTGKEWTLIRGNIGAPGAPAANTGAPVSTVTITSIGSNASALGAGIIGVASRSDAQPFKTDFKDTALENMGAAGTAVPPVDLKTPFPTLPTSGVVAAPAGVGKMTKYSEWKFIADPTNDHSKIFRAYHEGW